MFLGDGATAFFFAAPPGGQLRGVSYLLFATFCRARVAAARLRPCVALRACAPPALALPLLACGLALLRVPAFSLLRWCTTADLSAKVLAGPYTPCASFSRCVPACALVPASSPLSRSSPRFPLALLCMRLSRCCPRCVFALVLALASYAAAVRFFARCLGWCGC